MTDASQPFPVWFTDLLVMMLIGIGGGLFFWVKMGKRDQPLPLIYLIGLLGGFFGAKLAFLFSQGWLYRHHENRWIFWISGKSIMGSFIGGWAAVEMFFLWIMGCILLTLRRASCLHGQHFHLFFICYAAFRFLHEFKRATPKIYAGFSGYQIIACMTLVAAIIAWTKRAKSICSS